jgi:cysteine desulfurase
MVIYFDNSATTKPYQEVIDSFVKVSTDFYGNPSSIHGIGGKAEQLLSQARSQTAQLMSVKPNEIYFTSGGTEGNNLAIKGVALAFKGRGRHIITTQIEHASVREPLKQLESLGFEVTYLQVKPDGRVCVKELQEAIREDTILVTVMHVNNEVGSIQPIKEIGLLLSNYPKIIFHVDHIQGIGKVPLSLSECRIDLCSISAHKFHGLKGTGVLYIREGIHLQPLLAGGSQEGTFRSGTENVAGAVALAKALRLTLTKMREEREHLKGLIEALRIGLEKIDGIIVHTPLEHAAPHILNFTLPQIKSEVFVHALEENDIYVSTTSACSSKKHEKNSTLLAMGISEERAGSSIRISLSYDNTFEEVKIVLQLMEETIGMLRKVMK